MQLNDSIVAFRADASQQIGTGHVMRCLTLADSLRNRGAACHFICRPQSGNLVDLIQRSGYPVRTLPQIGQSDSVPEPENPGPTYATWLQTDQATDASETSEALAEIRPDWLIVDHYGIDARWEQAVRARIRSLMVIDDLADRPHDCDLLLDPNLSREPGNYSGLLPPGCETLTGEDFALLRPEFAELRQVSLQRRKLPRLKSLLVSMGGADRDNNTSVALKALNECPMPADCQVTVVLGSTTPWLTKVEEVVSTLKWDARVLNGSDEMARIMSQSDLAIGACGVTGMERACLGLPSIMLETADNQAPFLAAFEARGLAVTAPGFQYQSENEKRVTISQLFRKALNGENNPITIDSNIDGLGSERVADAIAALTKNRS